ncbi:hypothetical protein ACFXKG_32715 [Streptomyces sp. NPDC059255]|uniref:hypothetical protein n=1 Tax=Streptomyces sp. NPDC059255 TaxID=3346793 RepID=UPI003688B425
MTTSRVPPRITAGPPATAADLLASQERNRLAGEALPRLRAAALGWRNAAGALMAGLVAFGLVKGRTDVGQLAEPWAAGVGSLLLLALVCGALGAYLLNRAAHGSLAPPPLGARSTRSAAEHLEVGDGLRALRCGIGMTLACTAFLVGAVASTWYGPSAKPPAVELSTPATGKLCGTVAGMRDGKLLLKTGGTTVDVATAALTQLRTVDDCP